MGCLAVDGGGRRPCSQALARNVRRRATSRPAGQGRRCRSSPRSSSALEEPSHEPLGNLAIFSALSPAGHPGGCRGRHGRAAGAGLGAGRGGRRAHCDAAKGAGHHGAGKQGSNNGRLGCECCKASQSAGRAAVRPPATCRRRRHALPLALLARSSALPPATSAHCAPLPTPPNPIPNRCAPSRRRSRR